LPSAFAALLLRAKSERLLKALLSMQRGYPVSCP
jgi:hypothetical protein